METPMGTIETDGARTGKQIRLTEYAACAG
jgi:hypothetical protein